MLAGPTAVGKTDLAIQLAQHYNTVIVSADSRQFYRELEIGTAKPSQEQLSKVEHYFINNKQVNELYGAGHYEKEALALLDQLFEKHTLVILVGGSGLYIDALLNGVDEFEEVPKGFREQLNKEFKENGLVWLQEELRKNDKSYFEQVDLNNPQRMIRAIEICRSTGKPYSHFLRKNTSERNFTAIKILLDLPREELYRRIDQRVDEMMRKGLLEEVKSLRDHQNFNALKTVGYSELNAYLKGEWDLQTAITKIKQHTRNYAKRQLTWFRNKGGYNTFSPSDTNEIIKFIEDFYLNL